MIARLMDRLLGPVLEEIGPDADGAWCEGLSAGKTPTGSYLSPCRPPAALANAHPRGDR